MKMLTTLRYSCARETGVFFFLWGFGALVYEYEGATHNVRAGLKGRRGNNNDNTTTNNTRTAHAPALLLMHDLAPLANAACHGSGRRLHAGVPVCSLGSP